MTKGKKVSVKDCLELMRKYEATEATMKKFEESSDTQVDASYAQDPTKKSQRNRSKKFPYRPKSKSECKRSGGKKSCIWCNGDAHSRDKCPAKDATCTFCGKQGHFERACLQKKGIDKGKKSKHQLAVGVDPDEDRTIKSHVKYSLQYCFTQKATTVHPMRLKAKLTLVLWYPACRLPCFQKSDSPRKI